MRNLNQDTITQAVIARFAGTPDARLKELMTSLVQHLHAFAREVKLTEAEWLAGVDFLTATGRKCDDKRQEFILLSDTLGLSMLTVAMNNDKPQGCTEATVFGPFHVEGAPHFDNGADVANGAVGEPCVVRGRVLGLGGEAVAGAEIEVWQADAEGHYDVQYADLDKFQARGVLRSGADGSFNFKTIVAEPYPIPVDGPVGDMLRATKCHPWRPAHLHFMIKAPAYETLVTHVFRKGDPYLDSDAVFGVRQSLVADWVKQPDGVYRLDFDFVLNPAA
ncbi:MULTISPECIES: intradiol ring-cleavage dioxygenase [unclassified Polaromonas]|jgi:hydroxyquinol 1,2-dioxygenase|uniref:intradiol ring-cleavage dioxygenase n=1 Tax=unclassified Polaromonas TaxID=2638319 RepID=UPI000BD5D764|nr:MULTISPECIES: intradiol ring-cleavage dioxygenase [unclassified Polaromonas]OYY33754.1 MAG: hydroxyquinol 1,2-dioxygenase [Polaromonas sp. 35-63-35]OYZ19416.1 MAG: hydroxyquinol 1,2-dioxygenase [Polaromonas sp. 16-63-31]OYZ77327.1 MAG: hydroxyquinol 1,2-dioxygenase [Polaromonas sp. 24-63-21]OZA48371.1 MAG: hydroxyquinol 1,2-dioxygenase [Polaromonas sp. 17-63-33]OZA86638.1 MAG: hydroxyquinol 1,2-dioxygenase [Polaromonas sp. 39-63-25]